MEFVPGFEKISTSRLPNRCQRVDVELPASGRNAVLANIGKLNAVVTSGHCAFRVADGETTSANLDGELRTLFDKHWQTIPLGWFSTLSKDDPTGTPRPGLPGPGLTAGQRMWFAASESVRMHGFRWTPVPGAGRYDLRLRRLTDGKIVDQRRTELSEWSDELAPLEPGRYSLALRSVDARGMEGNWSPETELRLIGVVLPLGSYRTEDAIFLGGVQQVKFTNTDGLEMTYLGAGRYFPAVQGAGLYRGQRTVIGFRLPGQLDTAVATLEPRALYADVRLSPERAVWPRDPIAIDIQIKSKNGTHIPPFIKVVPTVTLGLDPVDVNFEQEGNTLHAVVPPSENPGPWIVRVDVADQYGVALGHDFLEIAAQPSTEAKPSRDASSRHSAVPPSSIDDRCPAPEPAAPAAN